LDDLPAGARVATGSLRRRAQLLHRRPDLQLADIRGNVETRLRKLKDDGYDALVLAQAGLERLGLAGVITEVLDPAWMLPAVGQGGARPRMPVGRWRLHGKLLAQIDDPATRSAVEAERALLYHLGGGCQVPLGAVATVNGDTMTLRAAVLSGDGSRRIAGEESGPCGDGAEVGERLAARLRGLGAMEMLMG